MWRFNAVTGVTTQIVLGFGIGIVALNLPGAPETLDFSKATNSSLVPLLRRV